MIVLEFILRYIPFRLNLFIQERFMKNDIFLGGMNDEQRKIALKRYEQKNPPKYHSYGPPFEPPWVAFPDYPRYSMGFRMGVGEDYLMQFRDWYTLAERNEIEGFQNTYPESEDYIGFYAEWDKP